MDLVVEQLPGLRRHKPKKDRKPMSFYCSYTKLGVRAKHLSLYPISDTLHFPESEILKIVRKYSSSIEETPLKATCIIGGIK